MAIGNDQEKELQEWKMHSWQIRDHISFLTKTLAFFFLINFRRLLGHTHRIDGNFSHRSILFK